MATNIILNAAIIGTGATAFMDLIALIQKHILSQQSLNYAMVGRWLGHVTQGRIVHRPISASRPIPFEGFLGWSMHYLIGVFFAFGFIILVGHNWLETPSLLPALVFGVFTVFAPFLVLQPGLGAGLFARRLPSPNVARLKSVFAHFSFGMGLWVAAICASMFFGH
ncbi:DUF2938 domain-containing protein [Ruegeria sp. EL01]|jgi:hypothetical protein|uniref:DUF2938 domain-containing protein n=1 Tax=Ruegeria sp. EL01 TaxID=2107578 RepID=UPI000EA82A9F|nr:DUF2938 domain-containing protein [Ruegeria sp. EL01]